MNSSYSLSDWSNFVQQHFCSHCTCGDEDCYMDAVTPDKSDCLLAEQFAKLFVLDTCRYSIESSDVEDEVLDKVFDICEEEYRKTYRTGSLTFTRNHQKKQGTTTATDNATQLNNFAGG